MTEAVAVDHVVAHAHGEPCPARSHADDTHAERLRGAVALEHRLRDAHRPSGCAVIAHESPLSRRAGNSATGEARRPLGAEGGDAFGVIRAATELPLIVALDVELLLECAAEALVDGLLGAGQAPGRCARKMRGERLDSGRKLRVRNATPDEAP